jgi:DNA repair protein RadD
MSFQLRPNQIPAVRAGMSFFRLPKPKPSIIVAPTAFGKSIAIAEIVRNTPGKFLILQPSKELLAQNYHKYISQGGHAKIYSASFGSKEIGHVTFATIGSIKNIGEIFKFRGITNIIMDECDRYPRGGDSMLGKFLEESGITHILGLTATPLKLQNFGIQGDSYSKLVMLTSKSKHGNLFEKVIHVCQVQEMVANKWWSTLHYEQHGIDQTKLRFNSTKADYTEESMKAVYAINRIGDKIVNRLKTLTDRKSILVFVPSVAEARDLSARVPGSAAVWGDMDTTERDTTINRFKQGRIRIVFNVNVLSVGFDHPDVDCIVMGRNTASFTWFYQALGRGTRISPQKKNCLVVDFSGNVDRFGKLEHIQFKLEGITWKLYGENNMLLSGVRMDEIGKHTMATEAGRTNARKLQKVVIPKAGEPVRWNFGKYNGKLISQAPPYYWNWCLENISWGRVNQYIKDEILRLKGQSVLVDEVF